MFATTAINRPFILLAVLSLAACTQSPIDPPTVSVLCYHTFDASKKSAYTLDSKRFREQLRFLQVQKIPVITMKQLLAHLESQAPLPPKSVLITIDDGYRTAWTKAWPILREFNFPFTLFIYPQAISRHSTSLTWEQVKEMDKAGVDIQSHSMTHPLLTHPGHAMNEKDYFVWLDHELSDSKKLLEEQLGHSIQALAYPYGGYDERVVERAKVAGYALAFTCDNGNVSAHTEPLHMNRFVILHQTRLSQLARYLREEPLYVEGLMPRDGERLKEVPSEIKVKVLKPDQILAGSATLLVDKVGSKPVPVEIDSKTGIIRLPIQDKGQHGYFFVSLTAKDRLNPSIRRETSWLFVVQGKSSKYRRNRHS